MDKTSFLEETPIARHLMDLLGDVPSPQRGRAPLYAQVADDLAARISDLGLQPDVRLPSEAELAAAYRVHRLTVRRALSDLARAGLLRVEHGVGTFVAAPVLRHRVDDGQFSLLESLRRRGLRVKQVLVSKERFDAAPTRFPDFPPQLVRLRFVRWVEDEPWSLSTVVLPEPIAPRSGIEESRSIFAAMETDYGLRPRRHERVFASVPADTNDIQHLRIQLGAPLLLVSGTNVDQNGRVIAEVAHRTRGDRAEYAVIFAGANDERD
jgi:GntR family transcriptional regulator